MSVFVSWSSPANQKIGRAVREFVSEVLGTDSVFMSDEDIEPGEKSLEEIDAALKRSTAALVIVSATSARDPWLNFEAGAMGVRLEKAKVIPILLDLDFSQLIQPLAQFQGIRFDNREKFSQMLRVLNNQRGESRIKSETLNIVFDTKWNAFIETVQREIDANAKPEDAAALPDESDKIDEILSTLRRMTSTSAQSASRKKALIDWGDEVSDTSLPTQRPSAKVHKLLSDIVPLVSSTLTTSTDGRAVEADTLLDELTSSQAMRMSSVSKALGMDISINTIKTRYTFSRSGDSWFAAPSHDA